MSIFSDSLLSASFWSPEGGRYIQVLLYDITNFVISHNQLITSNYCETLHSILKPKQFLLKS